MKIFEPCMLPNLITKNRLIRSATWDGLASPDGSLNDAVYSIYENLAKGGVGIIITGLTDVSSTDCALPGNMRLYCDDLIPDYAKLTSLVHQYDCRILMQLNMNEYRSDADPHLYVSIDSMTKADISRIIALYTAAAVRASIAGFDGIQLHLAYGWLLSRFVNPRYNNRLDEYGNSTENRTRIIKEIVHSIRKATPSFHISVKFSFFQDENKQFDFDECMAICEQLATINIDSLEILGSHSAKEQGTKFEACYLALAQAARKRVPDIPIILTGNNHDIKNMQNIIDQHQIDFFAMSRPLICEPDLPNRWISGDTAKAKCISCSRCYHTKGKRCFFVPSALESRML